jgi:hypothetical protein
MERRDLLPAGSMPAIPGLDVPRAFYWVLRHPAPLAGMARPSDRVPWSSLHRIGFRHLVCLTGGSPRYDPAPLSALLHAALEDLQSPEIQQLRQLHAAMDRAVLDAYGWADLQPTSAFLLDYEDEDTEDRPARRKKPWRYRWPDDLRDEVLARLLALNQERAATERLAGAAAEEAKAPPRQGRRAASKRQDAGALFTT